MARIRGKGTKPELAIAALLQQEGFFPEPHASDLAGLTWRSRRDFSSTVTFGTVGVSHNGGSNRPSIGTEKREQQAQRPDFRETPKTAATLLILALPGSRRWSSGTSISMRLGRETDLGHTDTDHSTCLYVPSIGLTITAAAATSSTATSDGKLRRSIHALVVVKRNSSPRQSGRRAGTSPIGLDDENQSLLNSTIARSPSIQRGASATPPLRHP